jgi:hypothetical protein
MHQVGNRHNDGRESAQDQHKRKYPRLGVPGFVGDLADDKKFIAGTVGNISTGGFEIINLPPSFRAEKFTYKAVLSGGGKHYKILAKPCWRRDRGFNSVEIGFKILDAPWEWVELTMHQLPRLDGNGNNRLPG